MGYRIGIDIGGTFTDLVLADQEGRIHLAKTPSTPKNPPIAMKAGLDELARTVGLNRTELLAQTDLILHGTTVGLNTLLQLKGAKVGLLCTKGFRDSIEIRLAYKEERLDRAYAPPPPLVPRYLRLPVEERVDKDGRIMIPLCEDDVRRHIEVFRREGVQAVAICFLWSFLNPEHERRAGRLVEELFPEAYVYLSVDVWPQIREYDRTSTTVVSAYIGPAIDAYIKQIDTFLSAQGYEGALRYVQSNGGIAAAEAVLKRPAVLLKSGPASGPTAGLFFAQHFGIQDIVTVDMGGTSFDTCLVRRGLPDVAQFTDVARYRVSVPMVNINTIGAGGGSIAWIDAGLLRVGPHSAEADPGPACYLRGGTEPTVTDANVVLGYLNPEALLGGRFPIDAEAARRAVEERVARSLGITVSHAALSIFNLVNRNMALAIQEISLERGHDPRDYSLVVGGGSGPIHAWRLAQSLGIHKVLIPKLASTFCAFGALAANLRHDYGVGYTVRIEQSDIERMNTAYEQMETMGRHELAREGAHEDQVVVQRKMELRYIQQIYEVPILVPNHRISPADIPTLIVRFHDEHERLYTYSDRSESCEVISLGVTVIGKLSPLSLAAGSPTQDGTEPALIGTRPVLFEEFEFYQPTPVYDGGRLTGGEIITGPAIIEEPTTTIVVFPGSVVTLDPVGVYIMEQAE